MATNTYVALKTTTVGTAVPSVTLDLTGITGYTDIRIVFNGGVASGTINFNMRYNSDSGSNYSNRDVTGDGSSATSHGTSNTSSILCNYYGYMTADKNTNILIDVMNYSNSTTYKTNLTRANNTGNGTAATVGLWRSTAAITSIECIATGGNFAVGSTFTVYGIASATAQSKADGGMLYEDSTYWYHVFNSSGTFTPQQSLTADILVVAGGGGGGSGNNSGGGGAGGLLGFTSQSLTATAYTVTIGAGGPTGNPNGVTGADSQFGALTLVKGGGRGGGDFYGTGDPGGSGGGNSYYITTSPASGTGGQGYAGGVGEGTAGPNYYGGGGGGASEAGNTDGMGFGGDGLSTYSSWGLATSTGHNVSGTVYYAGGGGGSGQASSTPTEGGLGGGGNGAGTNPAVAGTANTGGGGGGSGNSAGSAGKAGGSGIVIIRYPK